MSNEKDKIKKEGRDLEKLLTNLAHMSKNGAEIGERENAKTRIKEICLTV